MVVRAATKRPDPLNKIEDPTDCKLDQAVNGVYIQDGFLNGKARLRKRLVPRVVLIGSELGVGSLFSDR